MLGPGDKSEKFGIKYSLLLHNKYTLYTAWDSSFLDNIDNRLQAVEKSLNYFADRLVYDEPPRESVAGGLKNITDIGVYNYMYNMY